LLQDGLHSKRRGKLSDSLSLMADDGEQLRRLERLAGTHHMFDQRSAAGAVENFCQLGTHARPLTRGEDDNCCVGQGGHGQQYCLFQSGLWQLKGG
jgi:hypothetical protein